MRRKFIRRTGRKKNISRKKPRKTIAKRKTWKTFQKKLIQHTESKEFLSETAGTFVIPFIDQDASKLLSDTVKNAAELIVEGTTTNTRIGKKIFVKNIEVRLMLLKGDTSERAIRMCIFKSRNASLYNQALNNGLLRFPFPQTFLTLANLNLKLKKDTIWEPSRHFGSYAFRREMVINLKINSTWTYSGNTLQVAPNWPILYWMSNSDSSGNQIAIAGKIYVRINYKDV